MELFWRKPKLSSEEQRRRYIQQQVIINHFQRGDYCGEGDEHHADGVAMRRFNEEMGKVEVPIDLEGIVGRRKIIAGI